MEKALPVARTNLEKEKEDLESKRELENLGKKALEIWNSKKKEGGQFRVPFSIFQYHSQERW